MDQPKDAVDVIIIAAGSIITLITSAFGWIMRNLQKDINTLKDEAVEVELDLHKEIANLQYANEKRFSVMESRMSAMESESKFRHEALMTQLQLMDRRNEKIENTIDKFQSDINKFYQINPDIKNPGA